MAPQTAAPPEASAVDVAHYLLALAASEEEPDYLSHMRLQKLLYYAQAWSLADRGHALFREEIEAWTHGPVVRSVYRRFADVGNGLLRPTGRPHRLSAEDKEFIESVWEAYKELSSTALRAMTHAEDPWRLAYRGPNVGQTPGIISHASMREFFIRQSSR